MGSVHFTGQRDGHPQCWGGWGVSLTLSGWADMASRYIARRYGEQQPGSRSRASSVVSESTSRASSQIRETSSFFPRAASLAPPSRGSSPVDDPYERPWSSASHYTSSHERSYFHRLRNLPTIIIIITNHAEDTIQGAS